MKKFKGIEVDENGVTIRIYDKNNNIIYKENYLGEWTSWVYNKDDDCIYIENSDGDWVKIMSDETGNITHYETNLDIRTYFSDNFKEENK